MKALLLFALLASATVAHAYPRPTIDDVPPTSLTQELTREEQLAKMQRAWDDSVYAQWANEKLMENGRKNVKHTPETCGYQALPGMPTYADVPARSLTEDKTDRDVLCSLIEQFVNGPKGQAAISARYRAAQAAAKAAGYVRPVDVKFTDADIYDAPRSVGAEDTKTAVAVKVINGKALISTSGLESVTVYQNLGSVQCVRNVNWTLSAGGYIRTSDGCKAIFKAIYSINN